MQCLKCNAILPENVKFCCECGTVAPKPKPKLESNNETDILTAYEAADFLKISRWKIYDLIRKREIPFKLVGTQKRFLRSQLISWMQK
jgi:excisionase family DNA binding protein